MKIYFNGDSHIAGTGLLDPNNQSIAAHLSSLYNAEYVNHAVEGSSVEQILWRTRSYIQQCKDTRTWPDLVVIGFGDWNSQDWFEDGAYHSWNSLDLNYTENFSRQRHEYYKQCVVDNLAFVGAMSRHYNNVLYNLHSELFYLGVPHLFFNCARSLRCERDLITFDWANFYIQPYQLTFNYRNWCRYQGFQEIIPGKFHYGSDANQAWATLLYNWIQQHNLLTKDEHGSLYNLGRQRRRHYGPGLGEWDEELLRPPGI